MQRNHYLLNNIILPYIHQHRLLSTTRSLSKSSISVEHGSSFGYPTWSYPLAPTTVNDSTLPSRTASESSGAAQLRGELKVVHGKPRARRREPDTAAIALDASLFPAAYGPSTAKRKPSPSHQDGDILPDPERRTVYEETVHTAITKVVAIHARPTVPVDISDSPTSSAPISTSTSTSSLSSAPSTTSTLTETVNDPSSPPLNLSLPRRLPPAINALLRARQFRLAVFHLVSSPHLSSNVVTITRVAEWMEREGAGKLAGRLRRSVENRHGKQPSPASEYTPGAKLKLAGDERDGEEGIGRWHGYWKIGPIPPPPPDPSDLAAPCSEASSSSSAMSSASTGTSARRQRITNHFNAHLAYLLRKDVRSALPTNLPLDPSTSAPGASFPAPKPNLRQLRALLYSIRILERRFGFVPDRRTANLIVGCWLACVQPSRAAASDTFDPYIVRSDSAGEEWLVEKIPSQRIFKAGEIMALFGIVSRAMEEAVAGVEERFKRIVRGMRRVDGRWVVGAQVDVSSTQCQEAEKSSGTHRSPRAGGANGTGIGANFDSANGDERSQAGQSGAPKTQGALERLSRKDEGDIDYDLHIRPFAEMVLRSLKRAHGKDELRVVLGWKKEMRDRMELLRLGRIRVRQHLGLPVD